MIDWPLLAVGIFLFAMSRAFGADLNHCWVPNGTNADPVCGSQELNCNINAEEVICCVPRSCEGMPGELERWSAKGCRIVGTNDWCWKKIGLIQRLYECCC